MSRLPSIHMVAILTLIWCCSTDKYEEHRRHWGGGIRGSKSTAKLQKRAKLAGTTIANASSL